LTRIIAGAAGGRRLGVPAGTTTRPTSDRAREALFSTLDALLGTVAGRRFLDLYAGSGAVGLEALSRGATQVHLVENERRAHAVLVANVESLEGAGLGGATTSALSVERVVSVANQAAGYDVAFLDPPYALPAQAVREVLADLLTHGWLTPGGVVVVERGSRDPAWVWPEGLAPDRTRRYGEATLWYGRAAGP
jgi:16S rRNA (guanine966-N2)-methyltransferase